MEVLEPSACSFYGTWGHEIDILILQFKKNKNPTLLEKKRKKSQKKKNYYSILL